MADDSRSSGIEAIVRACVQDEATLHGVPIEVVRRLLSLLDNAATGSLDLSEQSEVERRIERILKGFAS